jgi:hypothetical protein
MEIQEGVRRIFPPRSLSIFYKLDHIVRIEVEVESVGENDVYPSVLHLLVGMHFRCIKDV